MIELFLFCIATVGMTSIIVQGVIFLPFRQFFGNWAEKIHLRREQTGKPARWSLVEWFSELINCAQCTGFWCGLFCGLLLYPQGIAEVNLPKLLLTWFCCGLGGSFLASLGCNLIDWVFYHKMNALRHLEEQDIMLAERRANLPESRE